MSILWIMFALWNKFDFYVCGLGLAFFGAIDAGLIIAAKFAGG